MKSIYIKLYFLTASLLLFTGGTSISGRVLFPPEISELRNGSCLSVSTRKLIKCKQEKCKIPPVASKTWEAVKYIEGGIPYSLFLPIDSPGSYLVSAVINNGWCKSQVQGVWIRDGDLYNDRIHDFELKSPPSPVGKNIQTAVYVSEDGQTTVVPVTMVPPIITPQTITPQTITPPKTVTPQTITPQTITPQTIMPQTITPPKTVTPQTITPQTIMPQTITPPQTMEPKTVTPPPTTTTAPSTTGKCFLCIIFIRNQNGKFPLSFPEPTKFTSFSNSQIDII